MILRTIVICVIVVVTAGHRVLDGVRELSGAGYTAPGGELEPWVELLKGLGLNPQLPGVAAVFVGYGVLLTTALAYYLIGSLAGGTALIAVVALGL